MTINDIAERTGTNEETVRRWIRTGKLNGTLVSKKQGYVVSEKDFIDFLNKHPKYQSIDFRVANEIQELKSELVRLAKRIEALEKEL